MVSLSFLTSFIPTVLGRELQEAASKASSSFTLTFMSHSCNNCNLKTLSKVGDSAAPAAEPALQQKTPQRREEAARSTSKSKDTAQLTLCKTKNEEVVQTIENVAHYASSWHNPAPLGSSVGVLMSSLPMASSLH